MLGVDILEMPQDCRLSTSSASNKEPLRIEPGLCHREASEIDERLVKQRIRLSRFAAEIESGGDSGCLDLARHGSFVPRTGPQRQPREHCQSSFCYRRGLRDQVEASPRL